MGVIPSRQLKYTVDGVPFECNLKSLTRDYTNEEISSDAFCQEGPVTHIGNYTWGTNVGGDNDFDSGSIDDTLFAMVGDDTGVATILDPTGAGTPGASAPQYTGTEKLASYQITAGIGAMVGYSASLKGSGAATRDITP
jgi:hypothetical protein